jgi:bifunctional DNase/RNase
MPVGLVEMVVESVRVHMPSSRHVVILKETERERFLPIWIGPWEASAIAMRLQGLAAERPLTHDLFASTLDELGVRIDRVVISALAEETFHARLFLETNGRTIEVDSRPSDALALAVRAGVRIYASEAVLDQAGLGPEDTEGQSEPGAPPLELTGETVVDPRLYVFRDFVNSLEAEESGEAGAAEGETEGETEADGESGDGDAGDQESGDRGSGDQPA